MLTSLYLYLAYGLDGESLFALEYPLADGTTLEHIKFARALVNEEPYLDAPQDDLAQRMVIVFNEFKNKPQDPELAKNTFIKIIESLQNIEKKSDFDLKVLANCYERIGHQFFDKKNYKAAIEYYQYAENTYTQIQEQKRYQLDLGFTLICLVCSHIELSKQENNRNRITFVMKYYKRIVEIYRTYQLTDKEYRLLKNLHIKIASFYIYHFDYISNDYENIHCLYYRALQHSTSIERMDKSDIQSIIIICNQLLSYFYPEDFYYQFWIIIKACFHKTDDIELIPEIKSILHKLNSEPFSLEKRRTYTNLTINFLTLVTKAFQSNLLPDNDINALLKIDENAFEEILTNLKKHEKFKLSTIIMNQLHTLTGSKILQLKDLVASHSLEVERLKEKTTTAQPLSEDEKLQQDNLLRKKAKTLMQERMDAYIKEKDPHQARDDITKALEIYNKLSKPTGADYLDMFHYESYLGCYHLNEEKNYVGAMEKFNRARQLFAKMDSKDKKDHQEELIKIDFKLIRILHNHSSLFPYLSFQKQAAELCFEVIEILSTMETIHQHILSLKRALQYIINLNPYNIERYYWQLTLDCLSPHAIQHNFNKVSLYILYTFSEKWEPFIIPFANTITLILNLYSRNSLPNMEIQQMIQRKRGFLYRLRERLIQNHSKISSKKITEDFIIEDSLTQLKELIEAQKATINEIKASLTEYKKPTQPKRESSPSLSAKSPLKMDVAELKKTTDHDNIKKQKNISTIQAIIDYFINKITQEALKNLSLDDEITSEHISYAINLKNKTPTDIPKDDLSLRILALYKTIAIDQKIDRIIKLYMTATFTEKLNLEAELTTDELREVIRLLESINKQEDTDQDIISYLIEKLRELTFSKEDIQDKYINTIYSFIISEPLRRFISKSRKELQLRFNLFLGNIYLLKEDQINAAFYLHEARDIFDTIENKTYSQYIDKFFMLVNLIEIKSLKIDVSNQELIEYLSDLLEVASLLDTIDLNIVENIIRCLDLTSKIFPPDDLMYSFTMDFINFLCNSDRYDFKRSITIMLSSITNRSSHSEKLTLYPLVIAMMEILIKLYEANLLPPSPQNYFIQNVDIFREHISQLNEKLTNLRMKSYDPNPIQLLNQFTVFKRMIDENQSEIDQLQDQLAEKNRLTSKSSFLAS